MKITVYRWPLVILGVLIAAFLNPLPWDNDRLIAGVPLNLVYHTGLCVAAAGAMWLNIRRAWPAYLDRDE